MTQELVNVRALPDAIRTAAADKIRTLTDFALPKLEWFNSEPCGHHDTLDDGIRAHCRRCGAKFRQHQRVGVAWLYMRGKGLIADQVGLGKTLQAAGLLAAIKQAGELEGRRCLVVCRPAALNQWHEELQRFLPRLQIITNVGTRQKRIERYLSPWDILVTGFQMLLRDHELLDHFELAAMVIDDVDALRNRNNASAAAIKRIARASERVIVLNGTPLQKRLREMHSMLEPVGGFNVFGSETNFRRTYEREELVTVYNRRIGRDVTTRKTIGYKNIDDFVRRLTPMVLRRTAEHVTDVDLPEIMPPNNIYLELYPAQKDRYAELRKGVLRILKAEGTKVKQATAVAQFIYGAQICAGLVTLGEPDAPGTSSKLDWVEETLTDGDLSDEKVVVFCQFTNTVQALSERLTKAKIGHDLIWGRQPDKEARKRALNRFWDDPNCRVLIGTSAMEQSLNLQISRHLINVDQLMNPARMQQLAGRIRRDGSAHRHVYIHNLLTHGTQEEGYMDLLCREQALADAVWNESNQLYEALHPLQLLELIGRSR